MATKFPTPACIDRQRGPKSSKVREAERTIDRLYYAIDRCRSYETARSRRLQIGALRNYLRTLGAYA